MKRVLVLGLLLLTLQVTGNLKVRAQVPLDGDPGFCYGGWQVTQVITSVLDNDVVDIVEFSTCPETGVMQACATDIWPDGSVHEGPCELDE
jgi:hypothetical protein